MGAAGFRDALKGVGLALASAEHGQRALERSLSSWSKCAGAVAPPALKDKLASTLKHDALPVLVAAKRGDADGLRACLQSRTEPGRVDAHDDVGLSPLAWAASRGHLECVETLIAAGSRLGAAAHTDGVAPLFLALSKGHAECATLLLEARAAVDEVEPLRGQTAQHAAAAAEPAVPLELLARVLRTRALAVGGEQVKGGAGVIEAEALDTDLDGFTALHIALKGEGVPTRCRMPPRSAGGGHAAACRGRAARRRSAASLRHPGVARRPAVCSGRGRSGRGGRNSRRGCGGRK